MAHKQEDIGDYWQYAKDLAKAERELKIEQWVFLSFEYRNGKGENIRLHHIDIPRRMLERWQWLIKWREAKLICENPKCNIWVYHSYYDKRTGLETGFNTLLSSLASRKAQVTKIKREIEKYITFNTRNNLFFNADTDEMLNKAKDKLKQKEANVEAMLKEVEQAVINQKMKEHANC